MDIENIKNRDFIVLGIQNWDEKLGSNPRNISYQFAKNNRVLYVDMPLSKIRAFMKRRDPKIQKQLAVTNKSTENLSKVDDNIWLLQPRRLNDSINWIPNKYIFDYLNKNNNKHYAEEIDQAIKKLGFKDVIMFYDNDLFRGFYLKDFLKVDLFVYYIRDFLSAMDWWKNHGARLEPAILKKADVIVANSTYYADYCKQYNLNSHFIGQGCDVRHFVPSLVEGIPKDIQKIKEIDPDKPIIGYVGVIYSMRLDEKILLHIAESRKDWNLVLVGPEDRLFKESKLHEMSNVHFLGFKDMKHVPAYMHSFDVCINPQVLNKITIGNYPLKIDEYLAMKKPVVATHTQAMEFFLPHVYLAKTVEEYIPVIEDALTTYTEEKAEAGAAFARSHTWEKNVKAIYKAINLTYQGLKGEPKAKNGSAVKKQHSNLVSSISQPDKDLQ